MSAAPIVRLPDEPPDVSDPLVANALWRLVQHLADHTGVSSPVSRDPARIVAGEEAAAEAAAGGQVGAA